MNVTPNCRCAWRPETETRSERDVTLRIVDPAIRAVHFLRGPLNGLMTWVRVECESVSIAIQADTTLLPRAMSRDLAERVDFKTVEYGVHRMFVATDILTVTVYVATPVGDSFFTLEDRKAVRDLLSSTTPVLCPSPSIINEFDRWWRWAQTKHFPAGRVSEREWLKIRLKCRALWR